MKVMSNGKRFTQGANYELNEKRIAVEKVGHSNHAINEIHANSGMTREEKLAAAKAILNATKEEAATEMITPADEVKATDTKSKVCVIANRLSKQGMSRSEAFRKAWAIVKTATVDTKVAGVTVGRRQEALQRLTRYQASNINISLRRETTNEYDANAVAVIVSVENKGSYTVGYLPRMLAAAIAPLIDAGKRVTAMFKEIRGKYHNYHNFGMALSVSI
jgi:hypothetical protein